MLDLDKFGDLNLQLLAVLSHSRASSWKAILLQSNT